MKDLLNSVDILLLSVVSILHVFSVELGTNR